MHYSSELSWSSPDSVLQYDQIIQASQPDLESGMKVRKSLCIALLLALQSTGWALSLPAHDDPSLKVGDRAPAFTLKDHNGVEISLRELTQDGYVAVVFYRSASW